MQPEGIAANKLKSKVIWTKRGSNNGFFKGGLNLKHKFYCQKWEKNTFNEKKATDISMDHLLSLVEGSRMKGLLIFLFLQRTSEEISCLMYHPHQGQLVSSFKTCFMWTQRRKTASSCSISTPEPMLVAHGSRKLSQESHGFVEAKFAFRRHQNK